MTTFVNIKASDYQVSFALQESNKFEKDHYDYLVVTHKRSDDQIINDIVLEDVSVSHTHGGVILTSPNKTKTIGLFDFVSWLNVDANTILDVARHYDGCLYYHNGSPLLYAQRGSHSLSEEECTKGEFIFITAYGEN